MLYDVVIIGGGPAGMTAAVYSAHREMKTLLIEKGLCGGYMLMATNIENYPGYKRISGKELSAKMEEQVRAAGVEILKSEVVSLDVSEDVKKVKTRDGIFLSKAVVIAVGSGHKKLEAKGEKEYTGKGVSYCATCDAPFFKNRTVAVIGGGNSAISDALYLAEVASKVYLIHRRDALRAEESRQKELQNSGVEVILNTAVDEIAGERMVNSMKIRNVETGESRMLKVDGVFISIGTIPHSEIAKEAGIKVDGKNFIVSDSEQQTNVEGVYAAGDVTGGVLQICTAAGKGCVAAISAYKYVRKPYWSSNEK